MTHKKHILFAGVQSMYSPHNHLCTLNCVNLHIFLPVATIQYGPYKARAAAFPNSSSKKAGPTASLLGLEASGIIARSWEKELKNPLDMKEKHVNDPLVDG